jgi:RNA polymerase subunit RPABC4/transcription elongation factor Spt4
MPELSNDGFILAATIYLGIIVIVFWIAMIVWAYRDMKVRSRDMIGRLLVALLVALLNIPGLLVYLLLRPRETLAEAYERSLEEEALLQDIEEKPVCPTCGIRTQDNWQVCPSCHTRLKKLCIQCNRLLELSWNLCPYCASSQVKQEIGTDWLRPERERSGYTGSGDYHTGTQRAAASLEFVEGDDY